MGWTMKRLMPVGWTLAVLALSCAVGACAGKPAANAQKADSAKVSASEFDGDKAFAHVQQMVSWGPRPVGSEAHQKTQAYIVEQLRRLKIEVEEDRFVGQTPKGNWPMTNIIGRLKGRTKEVILIGSHYDTKLFTDIRFVGANDGGSSTGAVLEIARVLAQRPEQDRPHVWFVFFDGEEAVVDWSQTDSRYGSRHLVERWEKDGTLRQIRALILLDMIGDKDLAIQRDGYSTRSLVDIIWQTARELGYGQHFTSDVGFIDDDHVPFLQKGVPAVDVIDFNYGLFNRYWHTEHDTLDKLSPRSLKIVGDVIIRALPAIEALPVRAR